MSLILIPEDVTMMMCDYLEPRDFYNFKTVVPQQDMIYWWNKTVDIATAVNRKCPSLLRALLMANPTDPPTVYELAAMAATTRQHDLHRVVFEVGMRLWPTGAMDCLSNVFVEQGNNTMFTYVVTRSPQLTVSMDTFDMVYLHSKWLMLSVLFVKAPRQFIQWVFGSYMHATDPAVIKNLRFVLMYLRPAERQSLARILHKYHEWLWNYKLTTPKTLDTIAAIHELHVVDWTPETYVERAMASPGIDYLEYLLIKGQTVEPYMMKMTDEMDKLRLLWNAQMVQKYNRIVVMIMILITAAVANLILCKIETPRLHNNDIANKSILHSSKDHGWSVGISLKT